MDASKTLKSILSIIAKDVRQIKKAMKAGKALEPEQALTLSRYAAMLNGIEEERLKRKERAKRDLEKKTTGELVELWLSQHKKTPEGPK